uniref:hypothetical protein n=1 Tax=Polaribacter sp. TaxID=1920175 RepID=UPI0040479DDD
MKRISKITSVLLLGVLFFACSKEQQIEPPSLVNPLEYIGIIHNAFMEEFTNNLEKSFEKKDWNKIEFLSDDYVTEFSSIMNDTYHKIDPQTKSTIEIQKNIYNELNLNEWFDGDNYSSLDLAKTVLNTEINLKKAKRSLKNKASIKDEEFTKNLLEDIFRVTAKKYSNKKEAYEAIEKVINKHEKIILSHNWNPEEKYALGGIAIVKHSAQFWKNYEFKKNSPKLAKSNNLDENYLIIAADLAGYVVGGVVGGAIGITITVGSASFAIVPGVAAFVIGKIGGAIAASAAAANAITLYNVWVDFLN